MKQHFIFLVLIVVCIMSACSENNDPQGVSGRLTFSSDTIVFDTLFVGQSSAIRTVMVYNPDKNAHIISDVHLGAGSDSRFRFNIDGRIATPGEPVSNIEIKGRDSLYLLVEYIPDEAQDGELLSFAFDSLVFLCNDALSSVKLLGVGREAILLNNHTITENTTLTADKPYLVFGHLHVPENLHLTLAEGSRLFMHNGANIVVDGSIDINGTFEHPVLIRGDRFDRISDEAGTPYDQIPNQWGGIYLQNTQASYRITNAIVRGMSAGIMLLGSYRSRPSLTLSNSVIHNSGQYGIYSQMADLVVENSEISNCGESCLLMVGGTGRLTHATIANYYRFAIRSTASLRLVNAAYQNGRPQSFPIESFVSENSIVFGQNREELQFVVDSASLFNVFFSHTLIKGAERQDASRFANCFWARSQNYNNAVDTVFRCTSVANIDETGYYNFRLDSLSFARNSASTAVAVRYTLDLDGLPRMVDAAPDLGAYEFRSVSKR